ncbi:hypothetical protein LOK46_24130 [Methylobacterium sp. NMS14P]|uniref:hypothetical protein n=1 Tax=Methylobacterium sp. NMS14P TaxID=2894310 RepID=UPI0023582C44|nr:hypothetical protein [Methylobacterium sp. NMS14P]WCS24197.1 hypothetical protein LOK46_24130 [Methylobacterium sp. NMS14P]
MERYPSTLATTGAAVLGLIVAAHVLHPGNFEEQPRRSRAATVTTEMTATTVAWVDPPTPMQRSAEAAPVIDTAALLAPRVTVTPPPEAIMVAPLRRELVAPPTSRQAEGGRRRKLAHRSVRVRQVALAREAATPILLDDAARRAAAKPSDPIGELLHGLGLGRGREG